MFATLRIALMAIRRNVLRSFLTMLGIIVGIAAVIVGVSMGTGAKAEVDKRIAGMGQNLITVMSGNMTRGGVRGGFGMAPNLSTEDFDAIRREVSQITAVSPEARTSAQVAAGNQNSFVQVSGVSDEYIMARSWALKSGENFTAADVRNASKICLIGATTAKTLFGEGIDPVGQSVRIKNAPFTIVGWLEAKGSGSFGQDQDDVLLVPYTSVMKRLSGDTKFRSVFVQAESPDAIPLVQEQLTELLRRRHKISDGKDDDFMVRNQQETSDFFNANNRIMTVLIGFFAGISLVVGGIGIMNIMLVSVTERTREIGLRRAVGAQSRDILLQFMIEATVLSLFGGIIGVIVGSILPIVLTAIGTLDAPITADSVVISLTVAIATGLFFGIWPARRAAQLNPIEALRFE